jgi:hypothetical protein
MQTLLLWTGRMTTLMIVASISLFRCVSIGQPTPSSLSHSRISPSYPRTQAQAFPDGPKEPAHYYTLIQPYDDYGQPSMPEFYPDGALGVPEVCSRTPKRLFRLLMFHHG